MSFSIAGKTAIVTGAANGVGLAIAQSFVAAGANVLFADMDESRLVDELGDNTEKNVAYFTGDLRQRLTIANLLSATVDAFDRVDILVNAARQVIPSKPLCNTDDAMDVMLQQNLITPLRLSQAIAKRMIKQAENDENEDGPVGTIINLTSTADRQTHPELMGYSVSTAALNQMTKSLAVALAPNRIRVNAVAFGSVMSASLKKALKQDDSIRPSIIKHTPLGRIAAAHEITDAVQFLASESAGFITGEILTIDGGRSLLDTTHAPIY